MRCVDVADRLNALMVRNNFRRSARRRRACCPNSCCPRNRSPRSAAWSGSSSQRPEIVQRDDLVFAGNADGDEQGAAGGDGAGLAQQAEGAAGVLFRRRRRRWPRAKDRIVSDMMAFLSGGFGDQGGCCGEHAGGFERARIDPVGRAKSASRKPCVNRNSSAGRTGPAARHRASDAAPRAGGDRPGRPPPAAFGLEFEDVAELVRLSSATQSAARSVTARKRTSRSK
jgi:hypothetical protein